MNKRHGSPYDRGAADSYYGRPINPHYFEGASYSSERVERENMTEDEIREYMKGYNDNTELGDFKRWD